MFPPMNPMGERVRHEGESLERTRQALARYHADPQPPWDMIVQFPRPSINLMTGIKGFVASLSLRFAANGRSLNQSVDCNPC